MAMTTLASLPFPAIGPVALDIGGFEIRWYALAYIGGILLGWFYVLRLLARDRLWGGEAPVSRQTIDDLLVWAALGIILGGRLGYVLFYNSAYYLDHPLEIAALWRGGMAFHGGLAGVVIAVIGFARARRAPLLTLGDLMAAATPFGLLFGRLANFVNGELYGRPSAAPWGIVFPGGGPEPRHPSQLYEALLEGVVLFAILRIATHRFGALGRPGFVFGLFVLFYGTFRIIAEMFRMPDPQIGFLPGGLTMGIALSAPMIPIGLVFIWISRRAKQAGNGEA
jgi:phosphatidylglycerol:prolipoprotein diacylglycerol transferase